MHGGHTKHNDLSNEIHSHRAICFGSRPTLRSTMFLSSLTKFYCVLHAALLQLNQILLTKLLGVFVSLSYIFDIGDRLAVLFIHMDDGPYGLSEFGIGVHLLEAD